MNVRCLELVLMRDVVMPQQTDQVLEKLFSSAKDELHVFVHGGAATPHYLLQKLVTFLPEHKKITFYHLHTEGKIPFVENPQMSFKNFFVSHNIRPYFDAKRVDYIPCFLSQIPSLFRTGRISLDLALLHVSKPDKHGFCSLGVSVDIAKAASEVAKIVIAQVNSHMPRVHGDGQIPLARLDAWADVDELLPEPSAHALTEAEAKIAALVASRIKDGATLQMGIGAIPNAVLAALNNHKHLGVHTEMYSDGLLPLIRSGVVDNSRKKIHPGKIISGFCYGSRELYEFINDHPIVHHLDIAYVNAPHIIARNPNVVSVNSAVEIDLTGQVCADSVGSRIISGVGGQLDFVTGAQWSEGGQSVIAVESRSPKGFSRIVSQLKPGAGVVTTRAHVDLIITEYGIAEMKGKSIGERAKLLTAIAHPEDREHLEREFLNLY
jgi:acyl-CoA hydrolase